ncbi:hypothetical protein [Natrialbaceae archaeon AArc-T1-2]|uniref:hypothetical protein n=1 Tax=Natrialbaceae archaeon AArc-T1-2 TaxID=3053904 RepID=UPI00255B3D53|nr:hypothetical protein [Natrialbaceae archaeon AArc-T1-2]WIV67911.1 hypothetical protein QQ977_04050 [Natrialbaceae archaeon AArc-T1-2]
MSTESDTADSTTGFGISSRVGWPIGGAVGGVVGAAVFGLLIWLIDPAIVEDAVPGIYGLEATGVGGWLIHLVHGAALGIVFGFLVTRDLFLGIIRTDVETDAIASTGEMARVTAAGFVYGLAVWSILPVVVLPLWVEVFGADPAAGFPAFAVESLVGHLVFGLLLGFVFATTVDLQDRSTPEPLEEESA